MLSRLRMGSGNGFELGMVGGRRALALMLPGRARRRHDPRGDLPYRALIEEINKPPR